MEDLLKGSGVEDLLTGGLSKGVAFVRKAMAKTKQQNKGYKPPARLGYDFDVAKELDKPSKHIQMNIGRVPKADVVKYKYPKRKKSDEEKRREEVMKFDYWGLSRDDFEEIDGQLIEKKHGLIWGPIFYQPTGSEEGVWGLRCCRYDKDGKKIPSNKKYEYLYVRDDDKKNPDMDGLVPNTAERWQEGEGWVNTIDLAKADPPSEITNTNDEGDEVMLKSYFTKGRNTRFSFGLKLKRRRRPFYWFESVYNKQQDVEDYEAIPPTAEKITYKDIPTIISANRAMRGYIKTAIFSKAYGSEAVEKQQDRWDEHLKRLRQRVRLTGTRDHFGEGPYNRYRDIASKEDRDKYTRDLFNKINDLQRKIEATGKDERFRRTVKGQYGKRTVEGRNKIEAYRDRQSVLQRMLATASQGLYTKKEIDYGRKVLRSRIGGPVVYKDRQYTQEGVQSAGDNRWGKARAEWAMDKLDDRQTQLSNMVNTLNYTITLNEALVRKLVKNPLKLPLSEVMNIEDSDEHKSDPEDIDRKEQKELMKKAEKRAKGKDDDGEEVDFEDVIDLGDAIEDDE